MVDSKTKTAWDKLKERIYRMLDKYHPYSPDPMKKLLDDVKAAGDELQEKNVELREKLGKFNQDNLQLMGDLDDAQTRIKVWKHASEEKSEKLDETEALLQLANNRCNILAKQLGEAKNALTEISEGKGRFSLDHLTHAGNCIEDMKKLAVDALEALK